MMRLFTTMSDDALIDLAHQQENRASADPAIAVELAKRLEKALRCQTREVDPNQLELPLD